MFTGIVEELGKLASIEGGSNVFRIKIIGNKVLEDVKLGDSISTNGVCLTVVKYDKDSFSGDVMPETLRRTNLGDLKVGDTVNLERAMAIGDRFGGHIVSGHIDGTGNIINYRKEKNATWIRIECSSELLRYMIPKGSIAIDGTSLTLATVDHQGFEVSIIPLTGEETTLLKKKTGDKVNLECDMIGKYVEKLFPKENSDKGEMKNSGLTQEKLEKMGFY